MSLLVKVMLGLLALVVLGAGAATAFVLVVLNNPSEATARYMPSSATAYFSINLRPGLRQTLSAVNFFSKIDSDELEDWREERLNEIEDETGIHPAEDTDAWLGTDISAAILNDDLEEPEWIVMLQVSDREEAEDFADELVDYLEESNGTDYDEDSDDGLSLWTNSEVNTAVAVSDEYLLIGDSEDTVVDIAENVEQPPTKSLLDNDAFAAAQAAAPSPRVAFGYLDLESLWPDQTDLLDLGGATLEVREELEGNWPVYVAMSTAFQSNGVRMDFSYFVEEETLGWDEQPVQAQQALPSDSLAAISTTGLLEAWEHWWNILEETDPYSADDLRQVLRDFEEEVGIDVEDDVLDSLTGELAMALLPSTFDFNSQESALDSPVHALFIAGLDDREALEDALDQLLANVGDDYEFTREDIGEFEAVTVPLDEVDESLNAYRPGYVVMDDWAALGTTLESLEIFHDAVTGGTDSLDDNSEFRRVMDAAPSPVHHFVYANIAALVEAIEHGLGGEDRQEFRDNVRPYIENLSAVLMTTSFTPQEVRASVILTAME